MPQPTPSPLRLALGKSDAVAATLILLGVTGMIRHFWTESPPESAPRLALTYRPQAATRPAGEPRFSASDPGLERSAAADIQEMKRRLREFVIPDPAVRELPVADALGVLQEHWQSLPHGTDRAPAAEFLLDAAAAEWIGNATPPQTISLEIPRVSILTNLRLLAAQTGLKVEVTATGVILRPDTGHSGAGSPQPARFPLSSHALNRFAGPENLTAGRLFKTKEEVTVEFNTLKL